MDKIDRAWISARLTGRHGEKRDIAEAMGIRLDQLSKVLSGDRKVQANEIPGLLGYFGESLGDRTETPGFFESQAEPYKTPNALLMLLQRIAPHLRKPETYRARASMPSLGILAGDIMILEIGSTPTDGDTVVATIADPETGTAHTVIRRFAGGFLVDADPTAQIIDVGRNNQEIAILGAVRGCLRGPGL